MRSAPRVGGTSGRLCGGASATGALAWRWRVEQAGEGSLEVVDGGDCDGEAGEFGGGEVA